MGYEHGHSPFSPGHSMPTALAKQLVAVWTSSTTGAATVRLWCNYLTSTYSSRCRYWHYTTAVCIVTLGPYAWSTNSLPIANGTISPYLLTLVYRYVSAIVPLTSLLVLHAYGPWCHCHAGVIFTLVSLARWCHCRASVIVTLVSLSRWSHCHASVIVTLESLSCWCHCHAGVIVTLVFVIVTYIGFTIFYEIPIESCSYCKLHQFSNLQWVHVCGRQRIACNHLKCFFS